MHGVVPTDAKYEGDVESDDDAVKPTQADSVHSLVQVIQPFVRI